MQFLTTARIYGKHLSRPWIFCVLHTHRRTKTLMADALDFDSWWCTFVYCCILRAMFWYVLAATGFLISNLVFVSVDFLRTALNLQNVTTYQKYANVIKKENMKMHFVWIHYLSKSWENHFIANVRKLILSNTFFIIWNKTTLWPKTHSFILAYELSYHNENQNLNSN